MELYVNPEFAEAVAIAELTQFREDVLELILNVKQSPEDLLEAVEAFHSLGKVLELYGK